MERQTYIRHTADLVASGKFSLPEDRIAYAVGHLNVESTIATLIYPSHIRSERIIVRINNSVTEIARHYHIKINMTAELPTAIKTDNNFFNASVNTS